MADLRQVSASLGRTEVATYIQSGNLVFITSSDTGVVGLADALEREIARKLSVQPAVLLSRADLARVTADNLSPGSKSDAPAVLAVPLSARTYD